MSLVGYVRDYALVIDPALGPDESRSRSEYARRGDSVLDWIGPLTFEHRYASRVGLALTRIYTERAR